MDRAVTQGTSGMGHGPITGGTYVCNWGTLKGCDGANPNGSAASGEHGIHFGTQKQKEHTIRHLCKENGGKLYSKNKKTHLRMTHGITGISLRRHLELR